MSEPDDRSDEYHDAEHDHYLEVFGPDITADIVLEFIDFLKDHKPAAKKSQPRAVICDSLLTMADYRIDCDREEMGLSALLDGFTPPTGWPAWGSYGKPKTMFHHPPRMEAAGLVKILQAEKDGPGRVILGVALTPEGAIYAYEHGTATLADVVNYWRWTRGEQKQTTTNEWLRRREPQGQRDSRLITPGDWYFSFLESFQIDDGIYQRYKNMAVSTLADLLTAVHTRSGRVAFRRLKVEERRAIVVHVLKELGHPAVSLDLMADAIKNKSKKVEEQVDALIDLYARPVGFKTLDTAEQVVEASRARAEEVINDFICRATWIIVRKVMDHRTNDPLAAASRARPKVTKTPLSRIRLELEEFYKSFQIVDEGEALARRMAAEIGHLVEEQQVDLAAAAAEVRAQEAVAAIRIPVANSWQLVAMDTEREKWADHQHRGKQREWSGEERAVLGAGHRTSGRRAREVETDPVKGKLTFTQLARDSENGDITISGRINNSRPGTGDDQSWEVELSLRVHEDGGGKSNVEITAGEVDGNRIDPSEGTIRASVQGNHADFKLTVSAAGPFRELLDEYLIEPIARLHNSAADADFAKGLAALVQFVDREGHARVPDGHMELVDGDNYQLGTWVAHRRKGYKQGRLLQERIDGLEAFPGWEWNPGQGRR